MEGPHNYLHGLLLEIRGLREITCFTARYCPNRSLPVRLKVKRASDLFLCAFEPSVTKLQHLCVSSSSADISLTDPSKACYYAEYIDGLECIFCVPLPYACLPVIVATAPRISWMLNYTVELLES